MYNTILVVVDLSPDSDLVVTRAKALIAHSSATLALFHVVEYIPLEPLSETLLPTVNVERELLANAIEKLHKFAQHHAVPDSAQLVTVGSIKVEILRAAKSMHADLIVIGNHARHGLHALFNFTEDVVLHSAPCDVLAIQLPATS